MDVLDEARRTSFGRKAEQYDAVRPSYPDALVADVIARAAPQQILEVGAGTGKATVVFAPHGIPLVALEPDPQMAAQLRRNMAPFPHVRVEEARFEDWTATGFDLVVAAQSFHWVEPAVRWQCAAAALRAGGTVAVLTNEKASLEPGLRDELDAAYARWMPGAKRAADQVEAARLRWSAELAASGRFGPVHVGELPWSARYTTQRYLELLETYSEHAVLDAAQRLPLNEAIGAAIDRRGGSIEIPYVTLVILATLPP